MHISQDAIYGGIAIIFGVVLYIVIRTIRRRRAEKHAVRIVAEVGAAADQQAEKWKAFTDSLRR